MNHWRSIRQDSFAQRDTIVSQLVQQDKVPWYSKSNLRLLYLLMFPTCFGVEMTSGFDASMVNGLQAVPSWLEYYHHPRSVLLGLMVSMYALGSFAAVPFVPSVVDKFGRRYPIFIGGITSIIGGVLQGSAIDFTMFIIARFILGFSNSFCVVAASLLIAELSYPKERAVMGCLFTELYFIGSVAAAAVTLGTFAMASNWGWRIPSFLQIVPSLLQVSFIWFLPESPRWLVSRERGNEAYNILVKYHAEGDEDSGFVKAEYAQIERALQAELNVAQMNRWAILSTPGMRKRVIITIFLALFTRWSAAGLISYFLPRILDTIGIHNNRTKNIINLSKYSWSLVNGIVAALIAPRYPRRTIYLTCTISLFIVYTVWTVASADYSLTRSKFSAQVVLALIFLYQPVYSLAFIALTYTFLAELFPFHVRAKGISIFQWWGQGVVFLNQLVNPIGLDALGWRWYITYCVWGAFQIVFVYFMFPETSGRTLEELTFLYEDDRRRGTRSDPEREALLRGHEGTETQVGVDDDFGASIRAHWR